MKRALFIFRRDLRLQDNTGLLFAGKNAKEVILSFIFTPDQIEQNPYRSERCLQFMIESIEDLEQKVHASKGRLYLFYGKPEKLVERLIRDVSVDAVVVNRDYTPYSIERDRKIASICKKEGVSFHTFDDALLHPLQETLKKDGKPYTIFTPFYRNASKLDVALPAKIVSFQFMTKSIAFAEEPSFLHKIFPKRAEQQRGGREEALKILKSLKEYSSYATQRDIPSKEGTTHLSPHLKFTTVSPREVYHAMIKQLGSHSSELVRSLYWRDFFTTIALHFPKVFKGAFHEKFNKIRWSYDKQLFKAWCEGRTGFPIVDAGMREMNQTGFMHNRVRMIAASFLVKDLHIDWRWGEQYFAKSLIDYDPSVNNGNWQWAASTGCDAQPYFRIFNPWAQSKKFDPECMYIKKWIPELADLSSKEIHGWHLVKDRKKGFYPSPIVDHTKEAKILIQKYRKGLSNNKF